MKFKEYLKEGTRQLLTDPVAVSLWLSQFTTEEIPKFTIRDDGVVDVFGDVDLEDLYAHKGFSTIDVKFGIVNGDFNCQSNNLTNLDFAPISCNDFNVNSNKLTTLVGMPRCHNGILSANYNQLTSFEGIKPDGYRSIILVGNHITSLVGVSDLVKSMTNQGALRMEFDKIKEGGLGLILIEGLKEIINTTKGAMTSCSEPFQIIQKYLGTDNIIECQSELIEAGFEEYAVL